MGLLDDVAKIVGAFKPIEIKNEIKNPSFSPVINYKSPTTNVNFKSVEIESSQVKSFVENISDKEIETIKNQTIGAIATNPEIQKEISKLPPDQLPLYLKSSLAGSATLSEVQSDFINGGGTLFPKPEEVFKLDFGPSGRRISNIKIIRNPDNSIAIEYDEN